jgi:hypothetical protein
MQDDNKTEGQEATEAVPTTEELAAELAAVEEDHGPGQDAPETRPDPAEPEPEAPGNDKSEPEPAAPAPESPAKSPEPEAEPTPEREIAPPVKAAQAEKKAADKTRRKKAIADSPRPPDPSEEDLKIQAEKDELRAKMAEVHTELEEILEAADLCRDELRRLSLLLNPHLGASDHHVTAVRGYVLSQKRLRATRATDPERIKAILKAAGKAPIDAAFSKQRARGMKRPTRTPITAAKPDGATAPGAAPPNVAE